MIWDEQTLMNLKFLWEESPDVAKLKTQGSWIKPCQDR